MGFEPTKASRPSGFQDRPDSQVPCTPPRQLYAKRPSVLQAGLHGSGFYGQRPDALLAEGHGRGSSPEDGVLSQDLPRGPVELSEDERVAINT